MSIIVTCVGPKGGPGKSTMARIIATQVIRSGYSAKIADHDRQQTCLRWASRREDLRARLRSKKRFDAAKLPPHVPVQYFGVLEEAIADAANYDFYVIDGAGKAGPEILKMAQAADIVVMPLNPGGDDLWPTMEIYRGLRKLGVPRNKLICVLNHVGGAAEEAAARQELCDEYDAIVLDLFLREKVCYRTAMTFGLAAIEAKGEAMRQEAEDVAKALITKITESYHVGPTESGLGSEAGEQIRESAG